MYFSSKGKAPAVDESIQLDLAADILKGLLDKKNKLDSWCRLSV